MSIEPDIMLKLQAEETTLQDHTACDSLVRQLSFIDLTDPWTTEWQHMPEYIHDDLAPQFQLIINFSCAADIADFAALLGQPLTARANGRQLQSIWYPEQEVGRMVNKRYIEEP